MKMIAKYVVFVFMCMRGCERMQYLMTRGTYGGYTLHSCKRYITPYIYIIQSMYVLKLNLLISSAALDLLNYFVR